MRSVSRFEHDLLRIAYGVLGQSSRAEALPLIRGSVPRPPCLSRDTIELLQAALAKGIVRFLARGGWIRERFLRGEQAAGGRLWQRWRGPELGMAFSPAALELLLWLTTKDGAPARPGKPSKRDLASSATMGDQFLAFLAFRLVENTPVAGEMRRLPAVSENALCRLAYPAEFVEMSHASLDWALWISGPGVPIFEALQRELAETWIRMELSKRQVTRPENMLTFGLSQKRVLDGLLDALETAGRRDLARFLLMAGSRLLRKGSPDTTWAVRLDTSKLSLAQRSAASAAALVFLRVFERLERWERQARTVGYFDEGYAASQLWKADWERFGGESCCAAARAIVRQSDPLRIAAREVETNVQTNS